MPYRISASTPTTSVAVVRDDPAAALAKVAEFEALGLAEIVVAREPGGPLTRDQLEVLAAQREPVAA